MASQYEGSCKSKRWAIINNILQLQLTWLIYQNLPETNIDNSSHLKQWGWFRWVISIPSWLDSFKWKLQFPWTWITDSGPDRRWRRRTLQLCRVSSCQYGNLVRHSFVKEIWMTSTFRIAQKRRNITALKVATMLPYHFLVGWCMLHLIQHHHPHHSER